MHCPTTGVIRLLPNEMRKSWSGHAVLCSLMLSNKAPVLAVHQDWNLRVKCCRGIETLDTQCNFWWPSYQGMKIGFVIFKFCDGLLTFIPVGRIWGEAFWKWDPIVCWASWSSKAHSAFQDTNRKPTLLRFCSRYSLQTLSNDSIIRAISLSKIKTLDLAPIPNYCTLRKNWCVLLHCSVNLLIHLIHFRKNLPPIQRNLVHVPSVHFHSNLCHIYTHEIS